MELYNSIIRNIEEQLGPAFSGRYSFNPENCWPETDSFELILGRDSAYELGGSSLLTANCTCITSDKTLVNGDEIVVYGKDLNEITSDVPYARISILLTKDDLDVNKDDSDALFRAIQDIDFVKYHVFPKGFMARTSALSNNEQVRVSKKAVEEGISFKKVGSLFIKHYKENPNVLGVKIIFVTDENAQYKELRKCAKNVNDITKTLSKIMEGMPTDCHSCSLKPICDEVEGMKELHFGKAKKK